MSSKLKPRPIESRHAYCPYHEGMALMKPRGTHGGHPQFECVECLAWVVIQTPAPLTYAHWKKPA